MTEKQKQALIIAIDFIERWNKQDEDKRVAEASEVLESWLEEN